MAQKFYRARRGMADKKTLEVCFAIDSDEDRDVIAEVDNTEGRTSEDTVNKRRLMMEPIRKRMTAFNAFCSEKHKTYRRPGLGCQEWAKEWKTLSSPEKAAYKAKAKEIGIQAFDPDKCLKNITKMVQQLQENVELSSCKSLCVVTFQKGYLSCRGFGPLARVLQNQSLHAQLMGLIEERKITEKKTTSIILRQKVAEELSRIAKRDLGLNQFPYQRVKRGEFLVDGVPPELLPLQPPVKLVIKQLTQLLACKVTLRRVPSTPEENRLASQQHQVEDTPHQTRHTQHTNTSHHTTNTVLQADQTQHKDISDCLIPVRPSFDRFVEGVPEPTEVTGTALTKTQADPKKSAISFPDNQNVIGLPLPLISPVQKTHPTYNTDMLRHNETLKETDTVQIMSHNALVSQLPSNGHTESMDFPLESHDGTPHQMSKGTPKLSLEGAPQQCSASTPQQHLAGSPQQCSGDTPQQSSTGTPQECAANTATKAKKPRLAWDTQALKALEESLGPLQTLGGSLPGSVQLDEIRKQKPVLQRFNINQIYQKLYKINYKKGDHDQA